MTKFPQAIVVASAAMFVCCAGQAELAYAELPPATSLSASTAAEAAEVVQTKKWGDLKGRFVVKEKLPAAVKIDTFGKDPEICGKPESAEDLILVDKDGGLANIMIYLAQKPADIHPDYEKDAKATVTLSTKKCRFNPHVLGMRAGQKLVIENADVILHDSNIPFSVNVPGSPLVPSSNRQEFEISEAEPHPIHVTCNVHPWMSAQLLIRPDPYFAISGKDGSFEIKNLPVGTYEFIVRGEKYITKVNVGGKDVVWTKGRVTEEIKPGSNDLGDIVVAVSNLQL